MWFVCFVVPLGLFFSVSLCLCGSFFSDGIAMPEPPQLPPIAQQPLSLALWAAGDSALVAAVADQWAAFLAGLNREHELLLIDDAADDRTAELAARHPQARVLRDPARRGPGAALRLAAAAARCPLLAFVPADPTYHPDDLPRLLAEIDKAHVVSGHRAWRPVPLGLRAVGGLWRLFVRVLFGLPEEPLAGWLGWRGHGHNLAARALFAVRFHDVDCPFRLFRRELFDRLVIQSDGPFVHVEVLAKANFLGGVLTEAAIRRRPPDGAEQGSPRWSRQDFWRVFAHPEFRCVEAAKGAAPPAEEPAAAPPLPE